MKINVYSIRDSVAGIYNQYQYAHTPGQAQRDFHELVNDKSTLIHKHPEGYSLWHMGTFDNESGRFEPAQPETLVVKAVQLVSPVQ